MAAPHERQQIRTAAVAMLKAAATSAGARVFKSHLPPVRTAEIPAINVYADEEGVDEGSTATSPRVLKRMLTLSVDAWSALAVGDVDDALDALALQIETAFDSDSEIGGTCSRCVLARTQVVMMLDGDRPMGAVHLEYDVTYYTDMRVPLPADDFTAADVKYVAPSPAAEDTLTP